MIAFKGTVIFRQHTSPLENRLPQEGAYERRAHIPHRRFDVGHRYVAIHCTTSIADLRRRMEISRTKRAREMIAETLDD